MLHCLFNRWTEKIRLKSAGLHKLFHVLDVLPYAKNASTFLVCLSKKKLGSIPAWIVWRLVTQISINMPVWSKYLHLSSLCKQKFFCSSSKIRSEFLISPRFYCPGQYRTVLEFSLRDLIRGPIKVNRLSPIITNISKIPRWFCSQREDIFRPNRYVYVNA